MTSLRGVEAWQPAFEGAGFKASGAVMTPQRVSGVNSSGGNGFRRRHIHLGAGQCNHHLHIVGGALRHAETGSQRDCGASIDQSAGGWTAIPTSVKDARRRTPDGSEWELVLLGEGEVPVREQLDALHRRGYAGYLSVEWEWHPGRVAPEVALAQHLAWLKAVPVR